MSYAAYPIAPPMALHYAYPVAHPRVPQAALDGLFCGGGDEAWVWMPVFVAGAAGAVGLTMFSMIGGPPGFVVGAGTGLAALLLLGGVSCGPWGEFRPAFCPRGSCGGQ